MIDKVVRDLRIKKGLPSSELSRMVGMNNTWVSQIETGRIKHPHLSSFKKLLRILDVTEKEIDKIIINEFADVDKPSKSKSPNKTDYRMEKKIILSKKKPNQYGKFKRGMSLTGFNGFLTEQKFIEKCNKDAEFLFNEIRRLPQMTINILLERLIEEV